MKKYNEMLFPVNGKGEVVEKKEDKENFPSPIENKIRVVNS